MTFRTDVILERLAFLKKSLKELRKLKTLPREAFEEEKEKWAVEHGLHLVAETLFDIGNHILVSCFGDRPSNYEEISSSLAKRKVIPSQLAERFKRLGGFRNILVHDYLDINFDIVYERLQNGLDDFESFAQEINRWLEKR